MKPAALQLSKYKAKIYLVSALQLLLILFFNSFFSFNIMLVVLGVFFFNI